MFRFFLITHYKPPLPGSPSTFLSGTEFVSLHDKTAGRFMAFFTLILTFGAIVLKWLYWRWLRKRNAQYTMGQATGLGDGVRQWDVPHTATNFIMKEMGYGVGRAHARRLQQLCMLLLDIAFFTCLMAPKFNWLVFPSALCLLAAAWVERWLFFAQAEHVSQLFYGKERV